MGNRCIIKIENNSDAIYQHWNGGLDSIKPLIDFCKEKNFKTLKEIYKVSKDVFGCSEYLFNKDMDTDNGDYILDKDLNIISREKLPVNYIEQKEHSYEDMKFYIKMKYQCKNPVDYRKLAKYLEAKNKIDSFYLDPRDYIILASICDFIPDNIQISIKRREVRGGYTYYVNVSKNMFELNEEKIYSFEITNLKEVNSTEDLSNYIFLELYLRGILDNKDSLISAFNF